MYVCMYERVPGDTPTKFAISRASEVDHASRNCKNQNVRRDSSFIFYLDRPTHRLSQYIVSFCYRRSNKATTFAEELNEDR